MYSKLSQKLKISLVPLNVMLCTYSENVMKAKSKFEGVFEYEDKKLKHYFVVKDGASSRLLGPDILCLIVIDWSQFLKASLVKNVHVVLNNSCQKYSDVFSLGLGTMKGVEACINVDKGVKPIFHKARPVPDSIKEKMETELEQLVSENIFQPVEYYAWASLTVPMKKSDRSIRICGDYNASINKVAKSDKYPVPKTDMHTHL